VPQALPLSIPAALSVGVLWAMRRKVVEGWAPWTILPGCGSQLRRGAGNASDPV
jgi:hypothetical protein